jgi:hypothetical protein
MKNFENIDGFNHEGFYDYCLNKYDSEYTNYDDCCDDTKGHYIRKLVDAIISIGTNSHNLTDYELVYFFIENLPDMEYGEVARFMPDEFLDEWLLNEKKEWEEEK